MDAAASHVTIKSVKELGLQETGLLARSYPRIMQSGMKPKSGGHFVAAKVVALVVQACVPKHREQPRITENKRKMTKNKFNFTVV